MPSAIQNTRRYYEEMYDLKLKNLKDMARFLVSNILKLNEMEVNSLNRPITSKEIETIIRISPRTKVVLQMGS